MCPDATALLTVLCVPQILHLQYPILGAREMPLYALGIQTIAVNFTCFIKLQKTYRTE